MLSKSLTQLSVEGPPLSTWGQTMVEVTKITAPPSKGPMLALRHSVPPALQQAPAHPRLPRDPWALLGKSGSVSCGVTAPFSWVLVHTRLCLSPPRVYFPVLCKFWHLYGGVNRDLLKRAYAIPKSAAPRAPAPAKSTADPYHHRRYSNRVLFQSRWGLWVLVHTRFV